MALVYTHDLNEPSGQSELSKPPATPTRLPDTTEEA